MAWCLSRWSATTGRRLTTECFERRLLALCTAHDEARNTLQPGENIDYGVTEAVHPMHTPKRIATPQACEYVATPREIWYIHPIGGESDE